MTAATATPATTFDPRQHEWVIRQYGDHSDEAYMGPGDFDTIQKFTRSWNDTVDGWNRRDQGRRPAYYMERADEAPRRL